MSNHNYSQYANKITDEVVIDPSITNPLAKEFVTPEVTVEPIVEPAVESTPEITQPETVTGKVVDCTKLNIRVKPETTATVATIVNAGSELVINLSDSTDEWFSVCTVTGVEGYCMRKFVEANL